MTNVYTLITTITDKTENVSISAQKFPHVTLWGLGSGNQSVIYCVLLPYTFTFSRMWRKWIHYTVYDLEWFLPLIIMHLRLIHIACINSSYVFIDKEHAVVWVHQCLFFHLLIWGHLDCFQFLMIMNNELCG